MSLHRATSIATQGSAWARRVLSYLFAASVVEEQKWRIRLDSVQSLR